MTIEHTTVQANDGFYAIAKRLIKLVNGLANDNYWNSLTQNQKDVFAGKLAASNGAKGAGIALYTGHVLHYHTEDFTVVISTPPPATPPTPPPATPPTPPVVVPPPTSTTFIADTLSANNTGIPVGIILTQQGSTTYTSADNGKTISNKHFTGRVTLNGVKDMKFVNCKFGGFKDYYYVFAQNDASNNQFNYCEWDCAYTNIGGVSPVFGPGNKLFRCHIYGADASARFGTGCEMRETLCDKLNLGIYSSHTNCMAMFDGGTNILIEDSRFETGYRIIGYKIINNVCTLTLEGQMFHCTDGSGNSISPAGLTLKVNTFSDIARLDGDRTIIAQSGDTLTFDVSAGNDVPYTVIDGIAICGSWSGAGGLTSAMSIICDFGSYDNIIIRRNRISGGSYACYVPGNEGNGKIIRNVQFYENRIGEGVYGHATGTSPAASILYWYSNIADPNRTGTGTTIFMPTIGGERRPNLKDAPIDHGRELTLQHVGPRSAQTIVYDTPQTITTPGVYKGIRYNKGLTIRADNVELMDCYISTDIISSPFNLKVMGSNVKVHHCEIDNKSLVYFGIQQDYSATATTVNQYYRNYIHHCGQAITAAGSYWDFYENYADNIVAPIPVPYPGDQPWHSDGVISWGEHLRVRKNKILISLDQTGCINIGTWVGMPAHDVTDVLVDSNYFAGAGFIFYVEERGTQKPRGFIITNNDIGQDFYTTGGYYGIWYPNARPTEKPTTYGNFLVDKTGKQLSACNYPF